jgi:very-short-patch-repair endonuclease
MPVEQRPRRRWRAGATAQVRARQLRQEQTAAEAKLWYYLHDRQLGGFKFRRQHAIGRFIVDFCCAERDQARTDALQEAGYRVMRYTNDAVDERIDAVLADLRQALTSDDCNAPARSRPRKDTAALT